MPLVARPVAFDSINFLPGFPSDSAFQCDPWSTNRAQGACVDSPTVIGRERGTSQAGVAIAAAIAAARGAAPVSLGSCGGSCGCGGTCGGGLGSGDHGGGHSHPHHDGPMKGIGDYGIPDFSTVAGAPLDYLKANAFPIVLGALAVFLIKKR